MLRNGKGANSGMDRSVGRGYVCKLECEQFYTKYFKKNAGTVLVCDFGSGGVEAGWGNWVMPWGMGPR